MFGPKVVAEFDSKYSGKIRVMQGWGYKYVSTGFWTQSGGIIKDVWQPAFKKIHPQKSKTWLILGLATGTIAKLIPNPAKIVGVEIDPIMINIGRKYFALDQIPNLKIIIKNANDYLLTTNDYFDYVLVDLYCADQIPKFVYSSKFLGQLDKLGQLVILNHLFHSDSQKQAALKLTEKLKKHFTSVTPVRSLTNLLVICHSKSDT